MSISDIKYKIVEDKLQIILLILVIFKNQELDKLLIVIIIYVILNFFYKYIENFIGGADIKLLLILSLDINILFLILISSFTAILYSLIFRKNEIKFISFISFSYLILIIYNWENVCQILKI